eukprot:GFYU01000341.1.p1 GENE.GFYU01000341.1~~GFYU01000341.1.p1  ORF type:complete len:608 (+),score=194.91 GFYU01000341.1:184-2007(+)
MATGSPKTARGGGNAEQVKVAVRVRPLIDSEDGQDNAWLLNSDTNQITQNTDSRYASTTNLFTFDHLFGPEYNNFEIYSELADEIVTSTMEGYNGTIFAYGQTASGKTYTMTGGGGAPGIIPSAIEHIFEFIEEMFARKFLLRASYIEIYNESINDLLAPENSNLKLHETPDKGVVIAGVKEEIVLSPEQILNLLAAGEAHRHVGSTDWNEQSSRSHTIFRLIVESIETKQGDGGKKGEISRSSLLNLIDLAGSERATSQTDRLAEGKYINRSLLTLGTVISKLSEGKGGHIPYRDSKITRLLQASLGGNARVAVVCCISPSAQNYEESLQTLKFASRAKKITNKVKENVVEDERMVMLRYEQEINNLRDMLSNQQSVPQDPAALAALEEEKQKVEQVNEQMRSALEQQEMEKAQLTQKIDRLAKLILVSSHLEKDGGAKTPDGAPMVSRNYSMSVAHPRMQRNNSMTFNDVANVRNRTGSLGVRPGSNLSRQISSPGFKGKLGAKKGKSPLADSTLEEDDEEEEIDFLQEQLTSLRTQLKEKDNLITQIKQQTDEHIAELQGALATKTKEMEDQTQVNQQLLAELEKRDKFLKEWRGILEALVNLG